MFNLPITFLWSPLLALLILVPLIALVYFFLQQRRQKFALRYGSLSLIKPSLAGGLWKRHIPAIIFLCALAFLIVALARPQATTLVPVSDGTVVLALDVSGSMGASDMQPSRIEAMKTAARTFINHQPPQAQVAIVAFSDDAYVLQTPTNNKDKLDAAINILSPEGGTAIGRGLISSLNIIAEKKGTSAILLDQNDEPNDSSVSPPTAQGSYQNAIVILLTDGENNEFPLPLDIAKIAADRGIRVFTVGIGSPEGTLVNIQGRTLPTKLDAATLKQIANLTHAEYYNATTESDLVKVYENLSTNLVLKQDKIEVTAYATGIALILAIVAGVVGLLWFNPIP